MIIRMIMGPGLGLHWYLKYLEHHLKVLGTIRVKGTPCVLVHRLHGNLDGMTALQVDDSLSFGKQRFLDDEVKAT